MAKKSSHKSSTTVSECPVVEQEKTLSSTPTKTGNEIDQIFAGKKRKKPEQVKTKKPAEDGSGKGSTMKKKKSKSKGPIESNGFLDPVARPRKKTGDGLVIYTEEELGIGKADGGGTPLCPFDCECCF
ncbi:unnamed protein product [Ilex paraguariensis]|uniref:DUF1764 domain-containing protein n=1 Tax=Ilex paraguariensis TaxID=185542 RepID=A0ABC8SE93_9AQUA